MIRYRFDVVERLREKGFSAARIRQQHIIGERTMTALRRGESVSFEVLDKLCYLLECDVGDLLYYDPTERQKERYVRRHGY